MSFNHEVHAVRVNGEEDRQLALEVMQAIYRDEKKWLTRDEEMIPSEDLADENISWFVVKFRKRPVGVLRVLYQPPLDIYSAYGFKLLDPGWDLEAFLRQSRIAEIGRFAVLSNYRKYIVIACFLIREAVKEAIRKGITHYITDVFEGEVHSPYEFHVRVMGFQSVATHDAGELKCPNRRITLICDIRAAYLRLRANRNWIFRFLTDGWEDAMHRKLLSEPIQPFRAA